MFEEFSSFIYNSTVPRLVKEREGVNFANVFVIDIVKQVSYLRVEHCYSGEHCIVHWPLGHLFDL